MEDDLKPADDTALVKFAPEEPAAEVAPVTAKIRLHDFETELLGEDVVRINGEIEKGHGSHFKTKLTEKQRHQHAALEHLVVAEEKVAHASASLAAAETAHEAAKAKLAAIESAADGEQSE